jgi:hypothetical protein
MLLDEGGLRSRIAQWEKLPVFAPEPLALLPQAAVARPCARVLARLASEGRSIVAEGAIEPLYLREPHITMPKPR